MDAKMKQVLPVPKLQQTWQAITTQYGQFQSIIEARGEKMPADYESNFFHCQFQKAQRDLQVVVDPQGAVCGFFVKEHRKAIPEPAYADQKKFTEIAIKVGKTPLALDGILSLPNGNGPFPALVLVHGSGSHDRDETIYGVKVFRDLAWGLASKGIAVLRYNKRNYQYPKQLLQNLERLTVKDETMDDALLAVQGLRSNDKIKKSQIFLLGHSLGGYLVPRLAALDPQIAGYVLMAGSNNHMEDSIIEQTQYLLNLKEGSSLSPESQQAFASLSAAVQRVKDPSLTPATPASQLPLGIPAAYWIDLRAYDPIRDAAQIQKPVLVLQGESDYQVSMKEFAAWKSAFQTNKQAEFKSYPGLGHCFTSMSEKPNPADYEKPGNVAKQLIEDTALWIKKNSKD